MQLLRSALLLLACCLCSLQLSARTDSIGATVQQNSFVQRVVEAGQRDQLRSTATYRSDNIAIRQRRILDELGRTARETKLYLKNSINADAIVKELEMVKRSFAVVQDGIFINKGTAQTERNLSVSAAILDQLIRQTDHRKKQVDKYVADLTRFRYKMDSLLSDSMIYAFPSDSGAMRKYLSRMLVVVKEGNPTDNALNEVLDKIQDVQNHVDDLLFDLKAANEEIESFRARLSQHTFEREFVNIWDSIGFSRPLSEIFRFSAAKERIAFLFYVQHSLGAIFLLVVAVWLVYLSLRALRDRLQEQDIPEKTLKTQLTIRHPLVSSLLIVLSLYQFVFINAPFVFTCAIWIIEVCCLQLLFRGFISAYWLRFWRVISLLFVLACFDNMILQASRPERWAMLALSLMGTLYGAHILLRGPREELREKSIIYFVRFLIALELLATASSIFGRYNLSKTLLSAGYIGIISAIIFIWVVRLINEALDLASAIYRHQGPGKKTFIINVNKIGTRSPLLFHILLIAGWFIIVSKCFYAFRKIYDPLRDIMFEQRTLGNYTFSISGLGLFVLIMCCALLLSKIVSFFAADADALSNPPHDKKPARAVAGSWILLLRIFIISAGLLLAFAASGLPIDKITIVLGALSVGIGLGLQGLVSNLVSGLIIAFERPVNVGDLIEFNGRSGVMKSIGFRSSIVTLSDGASLIVPNGDLLSHHVINWSMAKNIKRVVIPVSVARGSDLEQVRQILELTAENNELVMKFPSAAAIAKKLTETAIELELICWIKHPDDATNLASNLVISIEKNFREQGIRIPHPQQDIYIHAHPAEGEEREEDKK